MSVRQYESVARLLNVTLIVPLAQQHQNDGIRMRPVITFPLALLFCGLMLCSGLAGCTLVNSTDDWAGQENLEASAREECITYCDRMELFCVGDFAQYDSRNDCLATCADMSLGVPGDYAVDTVQCRLTHLLAAGGDPASHCPHASADGGGQCIGNESSECGIYCANFIERCPAEATALEGDPLFTCAAECNSFDQDGSDDDYYYNTLECRDNWLELARDAQNDPVCAFVTPDDALACNDDDESRQDCQAYCRLLDMNCNADEMECMMNCTMSTEFDDDGVFCATQAAAASPPRCMEALLFDGSCLQE